MLKHAFWILVIFGMLSRLCVTSVEIYLFELTFKEAWITELFCLTLLINFQNNVSHLQHF